jgi:hypothetical protein
MKIKLPMFSVILPLSIELKFYWYRALFAIFIYPVASLVISVGDTSSYLSGASAATNLSTMIMNNIGNLSKILSPVGINLIVCLVTTKFILWALKELKYTGKTKFLLYCILFTPSFTLYTSIVSKESIDAIGCCLFIVGVFEALSSKSFLNKKILLSIIIFSIFKSAYLLFIVDMLVLLFVYGKLKKYPDMIMLFGIFLLAIHVGVYRGWLP